MNLDLLMNVKPAIEEGLRGWMDAMGMLAYTRQNATEGLQLPRPRVEIICKLGSSTGHRSVIGGVLYNDTWFFDLAIRLICDPQSVEAANLELNQMVARVRGMMQTFGQSTYVDEINFPYHLIVEPLKDTTTDDTLHADQNEEFSILNFSGIVQIRTNAWANT